MSLSRVGGSSAAATSITIPAHVAGDLIVIWAYRDGSTTPPTVPTAGGTVPTFTTIDGPTGANACAAVCAWAIAAGTTDTSGTWTNATGMSVEVWRGAQAAPIGGHAQSGASVASGANIAIPAITLSDATGNSAILAFAGHQNVTAWSAAPSGYTQQSQVATECEALSKNSTTTDGSFNVTCTASATGGTRTQQIEILADLGNRVSQVATEALESNSGAQARTSQVAIEALKDGVTSQARVSQVPVEALLHIPVVSARVSQVVVELLRARADVRAMDFIASVTVVHAPTLVGDITLSFIGSVTQVYPPTLAGAGTEVDVPFIPSHTNVWGVMNIFALDLTGVGPGNGGETTVMELAPNGTSVSATLTNTISDTAVVLLVSGDSGMPAAKPFVVKIDDEVLYVVHNGPGSLRVHARGVSNTTPASHTAGASVVWDDSYDMAITAADGDIAHSFTADINSTGSTLYTGWLVCYDSTQAYLAGARYAMHVSEFLGVFDAGAGSGGTNRCDSSQPNAVCAPATTTDHCPVGLANPSLIANDIFAGDVALVRYTNPEASALDLGPRSVAIQSWFGLKRVDSTDNDVTFTDPDGYVVDTHPTVPGPGPFTGSIDAEFDNPLPLQIGIAKDASHAAGFAVPTPGTVPWETETMPGSDRFFTHTAAGAGGYMERGWPMCALAVRQGNRRVPYWESWDWHNYTYVYCGFGTDDTYVQILINRNGIVFDSVPVVELPGTQDIPGPDVYWDDATYYFSNCWYVILLATPYLVFGPTIGGTSPLGPGSPTGYAPVVGFPSGPSTPVISIPFIEGGSGGGINPPGPSGLHVWQRSGGF